ncbi:MAG TPA: transketolase C-terminal domain-containing protein [Candidatus Peribacteraceae bacterium]|nr:transketolase C-terminal domain-containing protein [Candidatus Peribacteraceae bacterium]
MLSSRPDRKYLIGKDVGDVPMSVQRIFKANPDAESYWIGPDETAKLSNDEKKQYELAHTIMCHLCVEAPFKHQSGHPGGPLSAFTFAYQLSKIRDPHVDQPLRISAGHLSLLSYALQWMFGRDNHDPRLASPQAIIDHFRIPNGLPGHVEAGIGDMPFGTGPLGKGVSHGVGTAFGLKYQKKAGIVDVLMGDGDSQEGQIAEAFRLASHLQLDNLIVHGDFNDIQLSDLPSRTVAADFAEIAYSEGWHVIEVQNGNDLAQVKAALEKANELRAASNTPRPIFIAYYTTMGNGISFMEQGSNDGTKNYHGSPLSKDEVEKARAELPPFLDAIKEYEMYQAKEHDRYVAAPVTQTDIEINWRRPVEYKRAITTEKGAARKDFGATHLKTLMKSDDRIVVLHADLAGSGGFDKVHKDFPDRVINVGVAEANMYMMAAGMRQTGLLPVTYTFAAFGTNEARANARLIDVNCGHTRCAILNDCTHAGLSVGEDGETHQEQNYLNIPFHHTQVWMPGDSNQAGAMAERALEIIAQGHQSVYVFSPRSDHPQLLSPNGEPIYGADYVYDGKADLIRGHNDSIDDITVVASGLTLHEAVKAVDMLENREENKRSIRLLNISCIRPIDAAAIIQAAFETQHFVVVEDHNSDGGIATQVADVIADFQLPCSIRRLGLNHYFPSGKAEDLLFFAGIDAESIVNAVEDELHTEVTGGEDAFVSAVYTLTQHLGFSRFREQALPFVDKLLNEKGYLEELRNVWKARTVPAEKLPKNDDLRQRLGEASKNSLGGMLGEIGE